MNSERTDKNVKPAGVQPGDADRELLSALADGELHDAELGAALDLCALESSQSTWQLYHLVGDVLRSPDLARPVDMAFMSRLREQLACEPLPVVDGLTQGEARVVADRHVEASNASVFRWKMLAGFASVAAVAAVGWSSLAGLPAGGQGLPGTAQQLAVTGGPTGSSNELNASTVTVGSADGQQVMIRDPRLDELLAAHKQFGSTSALQMPAGFLRNATFESPGR